MPAWAQGWRGEVLRGGLGCLGAGAAPGLAQDSAPLHSGGFWGVLLSSAPGLPDVPSWVPAHAVLTQLSLSARVPAEGQAWKPVHGRRSLMPWLLPTKEAFLLLEQPEEERLSAPE